MVPPGPWGRELPYAYSRFTKQGLSRASRRPTCRPYNRAPFGAERGEGAMHQHEHCACYDRFLISRQAALDWAPLIVMIIKMLWSFWS